MKKSSSSSNGPTNSSNTGGIVGGKARKIAPGKLGSGSMEEKLASATGSICNNSSTPIVITSRS